MSANVYDVGDSVLLRAVFKNSSKQLASPSDVTCIVKEPDGTTTTHLFEEGDILTPRTGHFTFQLSVDAPGVWWYRWVGGGTLEAAAEGRFGVRQSQVV